MKNKKHKDLCSVSERNRRRGSQLSAIISSDSDEVPLISIKEKAKLQKNTETADIMLSVSFEEPFKAGKISSKRVMSANKSSQKQDLSIANFSDSGEEPLVLKMKSEKHKDLCSVSERNKRRGNQMSVIISSDSDEMPLISIKEKVKLQKNTETGHNADIMSSVSFEEPLQAGMINSKSVVSAEKTSQKRELSIANFSDSDEEPLVLKMTNKKQKYLCSVSERNRRRGRQVPVIISSDSDEELLIFIKKNEKHQTNAETVFKASNKSKSGESISFKMAPKKALQKQDLSIADSSDSDEEPLILKIRNQKHQYFSSNFQDMNNSLHKNIKTKATRTFPVPFNSDDEPLTISKNEELCVSNSSYSDETPLIFYKTKIKN